MNNLLKIKRLYMIIIVLFPIISFAQVKEYLDRGIVALSVTEHTVYVSWRLLKEDPKPARSHPGRGGALKFTLCGV